MEAPRVGKLLDAKSVIRNQDQHDGSDCSSLKNCISCGSFDHLVSSSQCPVWSEKSVCELKTKLGLSYPGARRLVKTSKATPTPGKSYAQAARPQTVSSSTQTEPSVYLPPLKLLKHLPIKPTTTSNAATGPMRTDKVLSPSPDPSLAARDSPVVAQRPGPEAQRSSRPYSKGYKTGKPRRET